MVDCWVCRAFCSCAYLAQNAHNEICTKADPVIGQRSANIGHSDLQSRLQCDKHHVFQTPLPTHQPAACVSLNMCGLLSKHPQTVKASQLSAFDMSAKSLIFGVKQEEERQVMSLYRTRTVSTKRILPFCSWQRPKPHPQNKFKVV